MFVLGLSFFYHDSSAALIQDGKIIAAAEEERFSRIKHDSGFPKLAIDFCLKTAGISIHDVDHVVFYEKPFVKFERILTTAFSTFPRSWQVFLAFAAQSASVSCIDIFRVDPCARGAQEHGSIFFAAPRSLSVFRGENLLYTNFYKRLCEFKLVQHTPGPTSTLGSFGCGHGCY